MILPGDGSARHFNVDLAQLKNRLLEMAERAESLVESAVASLFERDRDKAESVIAADEHIDRLEVEIEQLALSLLALQHPVARDLRLVIGALRVANDIERIGDHAVNIAQCTVRIVTNGIVVPPSPALVDMARHARRMLSDALDAFIRNDSELGRSIRLADSTVDAFHDLIFRGMRSHMMEDARTVDASLELLLVSRNLERVADLATNIGENAVFLVEGKPARHRLTEKVD
jgi:phosphate transport system protein